MAPINGDKNLFFALSLTSSFSRERRQFALIVVELPLPVLLIAVSCRGISRLLYHRVIIRSKLIQSVEIRWRPWNPSRLVTRINFTFEIFRPSFLSFLFPLQDLLISELCILWYKSWNRRDNFSLS